MRHGELIVLPMALGYKGSHIFIKSTDNLTKKLFMKKLELEKMETIEGGVPRAEYCATLWMIMTNNPVTASMITAWETNCAPYMQ